MKLYPGRTGTIVFIGIATILLLGLVIRYYFKKKWAHKDISYQEMDVVVQV